MFKIILAINDDDSKLNLSAQTLLYNGYSCLDKTQSFVFNIISDWMNYDTKN